MKDFIDPFLYNVPSLDLHGYDRFSAIAIMDSFIEDNLKIGIKKIIIIHGKGSGILKQITHEYLKKDKRVLEYKVYNFNDGETIVILN